MNQQTFQKKETDELNVSDEQDVPFQGKFKRVISSPIQNLTAGIVHDEYNNDFYWGTQDGFLFIFRYNEYEKINLQKPNVSKEDSQAGQDNLSQISQMKHLNQKLEFFNIQSDERFLGLLKEKEKLLTLDQEQSAITSKQNYQNFSSNLQIENGKLSFNRNTIQKQKSNELDMLQVNLLFPNCDFQQNKKYHQNCNQGDQEFVNLSQQQQNAKIKNQDENNKLESFEEQNQSTQLDNQTLNDTSNIQKKDQNYQNSAYVGVEIDEKAFDQFLENNHQFEHQQNITNNNSVTKVSNYENVIDNFQESNKIENDKINQYNQDIPRIQNNLLPQRNDNIQQNIQINQQNECFFQPQFQPTQYINCQSSSKQNKQKHNKSQLNNQQKSKKSFEIEDNWFNKYCQKIKVSDKQVFEIVALKNVICLSFFGNQVIAVEKQSFQRIYQLKGDPMIYQGISFVCKSNPDEIIVRQDSLNGIDVWKINNFKNPKPVVKKLFQTSTIYQDQFHAMLVINSQLMIYGNNQGTINVINILSGKIVKSLNRIFKSQIINLSTNKKSKKNQQILIGSDSKWNFKIFALPYMQTITQFNVFNLGFTIPSFHQQLNIVKVLNQETILISGSSKQAVIYDWKLSKTLQNISYQNSNFYSFVNLSKQSSIILIKQLNQQKVSFLITEWN
ncbi:hypothetical protein ABPG72_018187 [Tetrahymena utriculariae]